ncbi:MAG: hypothetical protein WA188_02355 [Terriglobales bacterium]
MRITSIERLEDCFDGSSVYSYQFDQPWTRESIRQLSPLGELDYFADFPRPFFRIRGAGGLQVKGVEGLAHCRVVLPPKQGEHFRQALNELLAKG